MWFSGQEKISIKHQNSKLSFSRFASRATTRPRSMDSLADDVSPTPMTSSKSPVSSSKSPVTSSPTKKNVARLRVSQEQAENVTEYASMKRPPQIFVNQVRRYFFYFTSRTNRLCIPRHSRDAVGLCWVKTINNQHPSSIWCRGLNSRPLDHKPSALTARSWLHAIV